MRIALVNEYFPPFAPGGAEWSMFELGKTLAALGHDVHVVTPNYGASSSETVSGMKVHRFPFPKKMTEERKMPGFFWHANLIYYCYLAFQIYKIGRREKINLIHAQNKYSIVGSFMASRLLKIPFIASIRDTSNICRIAVCLHHHESAPSDCSTRKLLSECSEEYYQNYYDRKSTYLHIKDKFWQLYHWFDVHLRRLCLNQADAIVGVSRGILKVHEESRVFKKSKAERFSVYNFSERAHQASGEELNELRQKYQLNQNPIVLYVGGFSRGKGTDNLIRAARLLLKENSQLQVVLVGSGKLQESTENLRIFPRMQREDILKFYDLADLIVMPSTCQESFSRVVLEAMSHGKPIVGTRVGGTPEQVIHGENGFVVEREMPEALAEAITKILNDASLKSRMGKRSIELLEENFKKDSVIKQMLYVYEHTVQKGTSL